MIPQNVGFRFQKNRIFIFYLRPYSNNLLKRTVKTPKLYFFDTGLVAYLTKYSSPDILANGALNGAILENYVVSEVLKTYQNDAKECLLWYYRDKEMHEIDMIIESDGMLHPLEVKRSVNPGSKLIGAFDILNKGTVQKGIKSYQTALSYTTMQSGSARMRQVCFAL